jgi:putative CRISPR-associated protein (TIGR02619 family)
MNPRSILISTVGTSLFHPNLEGLKRAHAEGKADARLVDLAIAYAAQDWTAVAAELGQLPATDRICGAEINSIASMIEHGHVRPDCGLFFLHSDTADGRSIAAILKCYFDARHAPVESVAVTDLQDVDPRRFRTKGLRTLAKELCRVIRERTPTACAINATGGYKAQIAIAVLLGQAVGVPVFYKHERFDEIIAFPPMPVALDFEVWMRASGMLVALEKATDPLSADVFIDEWDERYESLVDRVAIDGTDYLELSPTGQVFHETFRERFRTSRDEVLPLAAIAQHEPTLHDHGVINLLRSELLRFLGKLTREVPFVTRCVTYYCHPQLNEPIRFRVRGDEVEGIFSDGTRTVKFVVHTTSQTAGQTSAAVAALNDWVAREL